MKVNRVEWHCPNVACKLHEGKLVAKGYRFYQYVGSYVTKWNHQPVPRYRCKECGKYFSSHTFRSTYRQKAPYLNRRIFSLLCSGMTQRRIAKELCCNRKTVARKFLFLSLKAKATHALNLRSGVLACREAQFDEMESFEHTRLKPLNIALAVTGDGKAIIDARVGSLSYKGRLAPLAFKKYGHRKDTSKMARREVLHSLNQSLGHCPSGHVITDAKSSYRKEIKAILGHRKFLVHLEIANQRKQHSFATRPLIRKNLNDPMFWLNHIASRIRHDLSRMMRKVWTTTKKDWALQAHLYLFIAFYNQYKLAI